MHSMRTVFWENNQLKMIDQRILPGRFEVVSYSDHKTVAAAITDMVVRGAPAIGAAAAFGLALAGFESTALSSQQLLIDYLAASETLKAARPTAVNLAWAVDRVMKKTAARLDSENNPNVDEIRQFVLTEAQRIADEDVEINKRMAEHGAALIKDGDTILTHCNTGALAVVDYGTALGVIRRAHEQGKHIKVFADETRPRLQGARLTAWELMRWGIDVTLIADNAAGHYMRKGLINICFVGSDRTAANGDVANKIGTYKVAVLAKENGIPFYPVLPTSTIDLSLPNGDLIPIEERDEREVTEIDGVRFAPIGVKVGNPAFDVTPAKYVTGIVTENGIAYPPFEISLKRVVKGLAAG